MSSYRDAYIFFVSSWTIDTKYYTADVCISTAQLTDNEANESAKAYALSNQCHALVLVFDLSNVSFLGPWLNLIQVLEVSFLLIRMIGWRAYVSSSVVVVYCFLTYAFNAIIGTIIPNLKAIAIVEL